MNNPGKEARIEGGKTLGRSRVIQGITLGKRGITLGKEGRYPGGWPWVRRAFIEAGKSRESRVIEGA